jgi:hypothetical protein
MATLKVCQWEMRMLTCSKSTRNNFKWIHGLEIRSLSWNVYPNDWYTVCACRNIFRVRAWQLCLARLPHYHGASSYSWRRKNWKLDKYQIWITGMRRITTFRPTTDCICNGDPHKIIILQYNIITLTIVLQLPTVFSTVTCCACL